MTLDRDAMFCKINVVSSATNLILNSVAFITIPCMSSSALILIAIPSATKRKSKADIRHPCWMNLDCVNILNSICCYQHKINVFYKKMPFSRIKCLLKGNLG